MTEPNSNGAAPNGNGTAPNTPRILNVEVPEFSIMSVPGADGKQFLALLVTTSGTLHQFFLSPADSYKNVASKFFQQITKAGADATRANSGIVLGKAGDLDDIAAAQRRRQQGGQQPRKG